MKALKVGLALFAAALLYLLAWPTGMEPQAWTPPQAPPLEGVYAYNDKLRGIEKLLPGVGKGPEAVNVDATGRVYAGYADGRVVRLEPDGASFTEVVNTGGRPLGITFGPKGGIVIADAKRGLLHFGRTLTTLGQEADGVPFGFTDDADNTLLDKNIYFTDASHKFRYGRHMVDLLEHGANGRLLEYNVATMATRVLLSGLHFANGVAVGPDDAYVLVNETGEYRILRYWLKGPKAGTHDVFIDNLPGFPDNVTYNNRDLFWVAIFAPRDALLDRLLPGNAFLRSVVAKMPAFLLPRANKHAFVLGLNLDGKVVHNLQYAGDDAYAPITSVREHGPWLYFGSLTYPAVGRMALKEVIADATPPPAGSQRIPSPRMVERKKTRRELAKEAAKED
ncbi:MAG TPA: SMP-30/gluconolactonase/LRE family protein [Verrucomicrobiae bacterium]|nr:SMP-30/gluconolactonase/LRE family protein [Verrucomicrobiae bacterium]